jgi:hypothetical protein
MSFLYVMHLEFWFEVRDHPFTAFFKECRLIHTSLLLLSNLVLFPVLIDLF